MDCRATASARRARTRSRVASGRGAKSQHAQRGLWFRRQGWPIREDRRRRRARGVRRRDATPADDKPITGVRIVFHADADAPGGGWGFGKLPTADAHATAHAEKGTFVVTSFSASAESVTGDQVNLNLLRDVRKATANTWRADYRPEGVLDTGSAAGRRSSRTTAPST
jgi:hypothetical protein